jgi:hypothetical protein
VQWKPESWGDGLVKVQQIDVRGLTLRSRRGPALFAEVFRGRIAPPEHAYSVDPLLVYDLDEDGFSEIILAPRNLVYRRQNENGYTVEALCKYPPGTLYTALLAEFDGDGLVDFLCATLNGLELYSASAKGRFDKPGQLVWSAPRDWEYPMVMTCGDLDGDHDLDVFLAQYRVPYEGNSLPAPYYDAVDGYPAFLLHNDGHGRFADLTETAGLGSKRRRRTYSASMADLDGDRVLDLVVVSDFAGVDLYRNNGRGLFTDYTPEWVSEPRAFGMSHTLADFNADGRLDLLMMGMPSPTVDRLEHLGLWRSEDPVERDMRSRMSWGNRLYVAQASGRFEQTELGATLARSGWSWGGSALDFDNDGWMDVYVTNGMESRSSVQDYESEYWLHDRFVSGGKDGQSVHFYLQGKFGRTRGQGQSYGGYERNRLFMNLEGKAFLDIGHLMGLGFQQDSRNVVANDVNNDGRVDLVLTSYEAWPDPHLTLRVFENRVKESGHWIGFRFGEGSPGNSPVGVQVGIQTSLRRQTGQIVNGDSYRAQQPATLHFGIGESARIERATIRWPAGAKLDLEEPAIDRYHTVTATTANQR